MNPSPVPSQSPPVDEGVEYALPAGHRERLHPAERVGHEAELCADVGAVAAEPLHGDGAGALPVAKPDAAERERERRYSPTIAALSKNVINLKLTSRSDTVTLL